MRHHQRVRAAVARLRLLEPVGVAFLVAEAQGIEGRFGQLNLSVLTLVEQETEAPLGIEAQMMAAVAADEQVRLELAVK